MAIVVCACARFVMRLVQTAKVNTILTYLRASTYEINATMKGQFILFRQVEVQN